MLTHSAMTKTLVRDTTKGTSAGYRDPNRGIGAYRVPSVVVKRQDAEEWVPLQPRSSQPTW
jgi:hypothetical protein